MFERYTEKARRTVFFARYYATQNGCEYIGPEHLLLGLLREDRRLLKKFYSSEALKEISGVMDSLPRGYSPSNAFKKVETLSEPCKWAMFYAAQEADLHSANAPITPGDLFIGILREEKSPAAQILIKHGVEVEQARQLIRKKQATPLSWTVRRLLQRLR